MFAVGKLTLDAAASKNHASIKITENKSFAIGKSRNIVEKAKVFFEINIKEVDKNWRGNQTPIDQFFSRKTCIKLIQWSRNLSVPKA